MLRDGIWAHRHIPWFPEYCCCCQLPRRRGPWWRCIVSSKLRTMAVTTSPAPPLVATRANTVVSATISMLRVIFRRSLLSGVHEKLRISASHFSHTNFFHSDRGADLIKAMHMITLANQGRNTAVSFWKTIYQLRNQPMVVDRRVNILNWSESILIC